MDVDAILEEARQKISAYLAKADKADQAEICEQTGLQKELVANVMTKFTDEFDWTLRPGDFAKEFFLRASAK